MTKAYEGRLNVLLSELLSQLGIVSRAELIHRGRQDVLVYHQGMAVVLEGSYSKQDAQADAQKRIEQLSADMAVAVHYPSSFPQDLTDYELRKQLKTTVFSARPVVLEDFSGTLFEMLEKKVAKSVDNWYELDLNGLASLISEVGQFVISEEAIKEAEQDVHSLIEEFVTTLSAHNESQRIAGNLYEVLYRLYGFSIGKPDTIKEAVFAQASLAILLSAVYYESIRHTYGLSSLTELSRGGQPQSGLETATRDILGINYEPVFEITRDMLKMFPSMPRIFAKLVNLASRIASNRTLLRRDLAGKVYHKVVGDWSLKKGMATFFTQVPAAYLLLHLAKPTLCRIGDFACGSGTLLVAAYSAANLNYRLSLLKQGLDKDPRQIEKEFHTEFIRSCYAFDVLEYAAQITALNLVFHSPDTPVRDFCVYALPLGYREKDDITSLGSLELVRPKPELWHRCKGVTRVGMRGKEKRLLKELESMEPLDLVAMNPPFTRTTGRGGRAGAGLFGFMSDKVAREKVKREYEALREEIRERLQEKAKGVLQKVGLSFLLKDKEFQPYGNIWQAGEGPLFVCLADARLKNEGKMCFVLPKGLLSGTSWFLARVLLAASYHIEHVIVSYDPNGGPNFSESTSLSECLLVARKVNRHKRNEKTSFAILLKKPGTSIEAIALANSLEARSGRHLLAGNASAFALRVTRQELLGNLDNWGRFVFLPDLGLLNRIMKLLDGRLRIGKGEISLPVRRLNDLIASIGVDAHRFVDTFQIVNERLPGSIRILHGGKEELRRRMETSPNSYALPLTDRGKSLAREMAGHLLVPDRIWVDTAHVHSLYSSEAILSNIFYAIRLKSEGNASLKALCLWLNTSWGILLALANRSETREAWIRLKQSHWRLMPVLDVTQLSKRRIQKLAKVFDDFKNKELRRIPDQYGCDGKIDGLRTELDISFLKAVGVPAHEGDLLELYQEIGSSLSQWMGK